MLSIIKCIIDYNSSYIIHFYIILLAPINNIDYRLSYKLSITITLTIMIYISFTI
jgi:hypothetical protein